MVEKFARFLAPLALAAVILGVYLVVHNTLTHHPTAVTPSHAAIINTRRQVGPSHHGRRFYIVRSGDTLSGIASRTGVPATQIAALNPALGASPDSLALGQRLRLRR